MTDMEPIENRIRQLLVEELHLDMNAGSLADQTPLADVAGIDSAAVLELLLALEDEFDVEIDEADIEPDDLKDVRSIARLIARNRG